jgi:hypothetical protein
MKYLVNPMKSPKSMQIPFFITEITISSITESSTDRRTSRPTELQRLAQLPAHGDPVGFPNLGDTQPGKHTKNYGMENHQFFRVNQLFL